MRSTSYHFIQYANGEGLLFRDKGDKAFYRNKSGTLKLNKLSVFLSGLFTFMVMYLHAQKQPFTIPLYANRPPLNLNTPGNETIDTADNGIVIVRNISVPTLTVYLPAQGNTVEHTPAVLICPGGGYYVVAIDHEGYAVARFLAANGIAAAVLKYRLPNPALVEEPHRVPLLDVQQALSLMHQQAENWRVDPDKIGIMGFSAGGHLAGTALTASPKDIQHTPDFGILVYPVISFTAPYMHQGSRDRLLGPLKTDLAAAYSVEQRVTEETPPIMLVHALDDNGVPVDNSIELFGKLKANHIHSSLHIVSTGGHGFGLGTDLSEASLWPATMLAWISSLRFK